MERVVANVSGKVRREKLHGRDYLVAPLTMLREQVLNGSDGPLFYPAVEWRRYPGSWNGMPLVVRHPVDEQGKPTTARDPGVLAQQWIGNVYRSAAGDSLTAEAWFDEAATRAQDKALPGPQQMIPRLNRGEPIELSTGLFTDNVPAPAGAVHNGVAYTHVATNYRPDHLAILPDQKGACSVADGCGVLVNKGNPMPDKPAVVNCEKTPTLFTNADEVPEGPGAPDLKKLQKLAQFLEIDVDFKADPLGSAAAISEALEKLQKVLAGKPPKEPEPAPAEPAPMAMAVPAANQQKAKPMTEQEWLAAAPPEVRAMYAHGTAALQRDKEILVARLTANVEGDDRRKAVATALMAKPLPELQVLAELVPAPAEPLPPVLPVSYAGLGGGFALNQREELPILDLETERQKYDPLILNRNAKQKA